MIYLDNAATSWPKPETVYLATDRALRDYCGNHGRSGHRFSQSAGNIIAEARLLLAKLFNAPKPETIILTSNATESLNLALKGSLVAGDHVITSSLEHNSVARPLERLLAQGVEYTKIIASPLTGVDLGSIRAAIKKNTKLLVITHISNVTGTVNPIKEIGELCKQHGILFLLDASQSAGIFSIDVQKMHIDLLAFPGHKGLLGPQGTGGLYIRGGVKLTPLKEGGTGSRSELLTMPEELPDRYESGTLNTSGIAGLAAGVKFVLELGTDTIHEREAALVNRLLDGLRTIPKVKLYGPAQGCDRSGVVSLTLDDIGTMDCGMILDSAFNIAVRAGLHCAPDAHKTIGTFDKGGTVRISVGYFNTESEIDACIEALADIASDGVG